MKWETSWINIFYTSSKKNKMTLERKIAKGRLNRIKDNLRTQYELIDATLPNVICGASGEPNQKGEVKRWT